MSGVIRELPTLLRDKIAAGEVVERPASVVKELVENSIDAGATDIKIEIESGGREFISVADNGSGIEAEYLRTAFLPHATSKIITDEDLENITTKGFRGEALASIAAVSRLEVISKVEDSEFALSYSVVAGIGGEVIPAARDVGTTITVSDLFYNTPARLKFLKKDVAEGNAVADTVTKIALAHPEVAFTMIRDGKQVISCRAKGDMLLAINALVSGDIHRFLKPVSFSEDGYKITGFVGSADGARASRAMQFFYVNGRYIKNKSFHSAIDQASSGYFPHGKHPIVFVFLTLPTYLVDVNVHPAKTEVRFAEERKVFSCIYRSVKSALLPKVAIPTIIKTPSTQPIQTNDTPVYKSDSQDYVNRPNKDIITPLSFASPRTPYVTTHPHKSNFNIDIPYEEPQIVANPVQKITVEQPFIDIQQSEQQQIEDAKTPTLRFVGEVFSTYIILEADELIYLMDKHAAHERIIYEKLIKQRTEDIDSQLLLTPLTVELDNEDKAALLDSSDYLNKLGIEIEDFGGNAVRIFSLPADIDGYNAEKLLTELASGINTGSMTADERTMWVYHSVACRAAVKAGDRLTDTELISLASQILSGNIPACCPHGRPVVISFDKKELEGRFERS